MKLSTKIWIAGLGLLTLWGGVTAAERMMHGSGHHQMHHGGHMGGMAGHHGGEHDEYNMPGLRGKDTTQAEFEEMRAMFMKHRAMTRSVTNLPDGIRTVTETDDVELRPKLVSHVVGMIARMQGKRNPEVIIQSATLNPLFERGDAIKTQMEMTAKGIIVTQTSTDPEVVQLLQTHAAEVSDLAARGMAAVHECMQGQHHR